MNFKNFLNILNPQPKIGALEINDLELKFCRLDGNVPFLTSLKLPVETIKDGKIVNRENFLISLIKLHQQIVSKRKKKICAVINIPDSHIYTQVFTLPAVGNNHFEEAAKLNLQMISPIDFENAYADWQMISKNIGPSGESEFLGGFVGKQIVDEFDIVLKEAGFMPSAIEFPGLSLTRLAADFGAFEDANSYLLLYVGGQGLSFNLIKEGSLYFNHFVSWQSVYGNERKVTFEAFKKFVVDEIKRVMSFYGSRFNGQINNFVLVSSGLEKEILKAVSENFSVKVQSLTLKKFKDLPIDWFPVFGSALRGVIPRSQDIIISLASVGTEQEFYWQKIIYFATVWRNVVLTLIGVILAVFVLTDGFLIKTENSLNERLSTLWGEGNPIQRQQSEIVELNLLKRKVENFNEKIGLVSSAYGQRLSWTLFLEKMKELADNDIILTRLFIQSPQMPVLINAQAVNEAAALEFKKKLEGDPQFEAVEMPIAKITPTAGGINFTIVFKIKAIE